ncbi:MAG: antibiotic biosynthesis monooxygenase [Caulobacter sp.]|nr:antibiotic biosynthesis monooxygenase [Caulobacter sp.]
MLVVTGTVTARPDSFEAMLEAALHHVRRSRTEPGCLKHGVSIDAEDPLTLVFYEEWQDRAALDAHFQVPDSLAFMRAMRSLAASQTKLKILPVESRA